MRRRPLRSRGYPYGYGYVNQRAFAAGAPESARWRTIMAYLSQCRDEGDFYCESPLRFSNPRQSYNGDLLGIPGDTGPPSVEGPSDAARALNNVRGTVESFRSAADANSPELVVGLAAVDDATTAPIAIDLTSPSVDTWLALRNAAGLVTFDDDGGGETNSRISQTLDAGAYTIEATTYLGGETGPFTLTLHAEDAGTPILFTDDPIEPGVTPVRALHFTELRAGIDQLRAAHGLDPFPWTDPTLATGASVRGLHVTELRTALRQSYDAAGRTRVFSTEPVEPGRVIQAWHVNELRRAIEALARQ